MSEFGLFWNSRNHDRIYNADSFSEWLRKFFTTGVFNGDLYVESAGGMDITVGAGYANIDGKVMFFEADAEFTLDVAYSTVNRVDTVVIERNDADRIFELKVVKGGTDGNPVPPVRENGIYQLVVAQIAVGKGVTQITQANITDTRMDSALCGYVTGTVEELPWNQITAQWSAYYNEFKAEQMQDYTDWTAAQKALWLAWFNQIESDWETWYAYVQQLLDETTAKRLSDGLEALSEDLEENYYTKTDSNARFDRSNTMVSMTLTVASWDANNTYSFESNYPSSRYDILDILPVETVTDDQRKAWVDADCGGYYSTNIIKAHGKKPTVDIPVKLLVRDRG